MDLPDLRPALEGPEGDHALLPRPELDEDVGPVHSDDGAVDELEGVGTPLRLFSPAGRVKAGHGGGRGAQCLGVSRRDSGVHRSLS